MQRACLLQAQVFLLKQRGRLGISCIDNPEGDGAMVSELVDGSVAHQAGLNVGDCITTVNGNMVSGHQECIAVIDRVPDRVALVLSRTCQPSLHLSVVNCACHAILPTRKSERSREAEFLCAPQGPLGGCCSTRAMGASASL